MSWDEFVTVIVVIENTPLDVTDQDDAQSVEDPSKAQYSSECFIADQRGNTFLRFLHAENVVQAFDLHLKVTFKNV